MDNGIKLDEIVNFYLDQWELPDGQYRRIHSLGVRAYRQIYMHATASPVPVEIEVLPNKTANLPCDYLNKITLGVMNSNGEISSLTEDELLGLGNQTSIGRLDQKTQQVTVDDDNYIFYNENGNLLPPFAFMELGVGARSDLGFYRIDLETRTIIFDFMFPYTTVWLEYMPIYTDNGEYTVNHFFVEAIISFIGWKDQRRSFNDRRDAERTWWNELRVGKRSMKPFDPSQAFAQYYRTTRPGRR